MSRRWVFVSHARFVNDAVNCWKLKGTKETQMRLCWPVYAARSMSWYKIIAFFAKSQKEEKEKRRRRTGNTHFIHSISFLAMPLCAFSKKIRKLKKGYLYLFIPQNQLYVGPYPAKDHYMPEVMSVKGRKTSEEGHAAQRGKILIFKNFTLSACQTSNC